jgi:hypothetical protein
MQYKKESGREEGGGGSMKERENRGEKGGWCRYFVD